MSSAPPISIAKPKRDPRIDVFRGIALMMIFVDHIPDDILNRITLHNFSFSDAAEVFVLLAGFSAMSAYGRVFARDGAIGGLRRVALRCARIYGFQLGLLFTTFLVVRSWTEHYHLQPTIFAAMLGHPVAGLARGVALEALPNYLDILPLYVFLLSLFPLLYFAIRFSPALTLLLSAMIWGSALIDHNFDLPNWRDSNGWYFDPFAWQFLFTIGAVLANALAQSNGVLPRRRWALALCAGYLVFAFFQATPWQNWSLPDLRLIDMALPDKSRLNPFRVANVLALFYVLMTSTRVSAIARSSWVRVADSCGRHSLEVFAVNCVMALFGRLIFRTYGVGMATQIGVNILGLGTMCIAAAWLDYGWRMTQAPFALRFGSKKGATQKIA